MVELVDTAHSKCAGEIRPDSSSGQGTTVRASVLTLTMRRKRGVSTPHTSPGSMGRILVHRQDGGPPLSFSSSFLLPSRVAYSCAGGQPLIGPIAQRVEHPAHNRAEERFKPASDHHAKPQPPVILLQYTRSFFVVWLYKFVSKGGDTMQKVLSPLKAIRAYCRKCKGNNALAIENCDYEKCPLHI